MWIWFVLASGLFNVVGSMILNTNDIGSFLIFKSLPFLSGLGCLMYFLIEMNLIG